MWRQTKTKSKTVPTKLSDKDYEQLGRQIERLLVTDYINALHNTPRQIWNSFVRGAFGGLGGVIGATLGVAALLFLLQHFGGLPVIGQVFRSISDSIRSTRKY